MQLLRASACERRHSCVGHQRCMALHAPRLTTCCALTHTQGQGPPASDPLVAAATAWVCAVPPAQVAGGCGPVAGPPLWQAAAAELQWRQQCTTLQPALLGHS